MCTGLLKRIVLLGLSLWLPLTPAAETICLRPVPQNALEREQSKSGFAQALMTEAMRILDQDTAVSQDFKSCLELVSDWNDARAKSRLDGHACADFASVLEELPARAMQVRIGMALSFPPETFGLASRLFEFDSQVNTTLRALPYWPFGSGKEPLMETERKLAQAAFYSHWDATIRTYITLMERRRCALEQGAFMDEGIRRGLSTQAALQAALAQPTREQRAYRAWEINDSSWQNFIRRSFAVFRMNQFKQAMRALDGFRTLAYLKPALPVPRDLVRALDSEQIVRDRMKSYFANLRVRAQADPEAVRKLVPVLRGAAVNVLAANRRQPLCHGFDLYIRESESRAMWTMVAEAAALIYAGIKLPAMYFLPLLGAYDVYTLQGPRQEAAQAADLFLATSNLEENLMEAHAYCMAAESARQQEGVTAVTLMLLGLTIRAPLTFTNMVPTAAYLSLPHIMGSGRVAEMCELHQPSPIVPAKLLKRECQ